MSRKPASTPSEHGLSPALRTALVVLAAGALASLTPAVIGAQTAEDSVAVRAQVEAYGRAWDTHDPSALGAFFTEDADVVMGNQPAAVGRQAIEDSWRAYFSHQEPERHLALDVRSVRFVTADVAVVNVGTTTGGRDQQGRELLARKFRGSWVVDRQDGRWLIRAMRGLPTEEDRVVLNASLGAADALKPEIRAFIEAYEDAFNSHDPSAVSAFFANDADIIVRNGPVTHGRQAVQNWWESYFSEARPYRAIFIPEDVRMLSPDVALVNVVATGAALEVETRPAPVRYARGTWLLVRGDGGWLATALWVLPSEDDRIIRGGGR
jgi:uncharacterized protein (TIGR02246 family)